MPIRGLQIYRDKKRRAIGLSTKKASIFEAAAPKGQGLTVGTQRGGFNLSNKGLKTFKADDSSLKKPEDITVRIANATKSALRPVTPMTHPITRAQAIGSSAGRIPHRPTTTFGKQLQDQVGAVVKRNEALRKKIIKGRRILNKTGDFRKVLK